MSFRVVFCFALFGTALILASNKRDLLSDKPPIPRNLPRVTLFNETIGKFIPQNLWIAVKDRNDEMPGHWKEFFIRNSAWTVNICDNACKDEFMKTVFGHSSVYWAYSVINPVMGAAKADIWRYAVLYTYGGVYFDDDSDMKTPLDQVISSTDRLIMSEEGSSSLGDCYIPTYKLSDVYAYTTYSANYTSAIHYSGLNDKNQPTFFHDHTLINWAIFTMPRHPLFARVLHNIVDIVRSEYHRISVVHMTQWDVKWKQVMCTTGFTLTYTLRELELEKSMQDSDYPRICSNNFKQYKGNVKAIWTGGDKLHYMKQNAHILQELAPLDLPLVVSFLHNRVVMGDKPSKTIYYISHGKKYTFGGYDIFLNMNFTSAQTRFVHDTILSQIPEGGVISDIDKFRIEQAQLHIQQTNSASVATKSQATVPMQQGHAVQAQGGGGGGGGVKIHLKRIMKQLNNLTINCFNDDYDGSRDDLIRDTHKAIIGDLPVMVYPFCARTFQLGNTLGYYLNDVACADISGAHFVAVHKSFNLLQPEALATKGNDRYALLNHLPDLIIHEEPRPVHEVKVLMKQKCDCLQYCWENTAAPWLQRVPLIAKVLSTAIHAYERIAHVSLLHTELNNATDFSSVSSSDSHHQSSLLPVYPNVTIQYRCGDNIGFGKTRYGLLPFRAYNSHRIPVAMAKYIYVIADAPDRNPNSAYGGRCGIILERFFLYLRKQFPQAVVVVKRGGDPFLDYARIMRSSIVFCSASTFCLWPALANRHGTVYYPLTPLVAGAGTNVTAPKLTKNFHWIEDIEMIKLFKHYRPWSKVIDDLEKE